MTAFFLGHNLCTNSMSRALHFRYMADTSSGGSPSTSSPVSASKFTDPSAFRVARMRFLLSPAVQRTRFAAAACSVSNWLMRRLRSGMCYVFAGTLNQFECAEGCA